jgi:hypothetical protein
MAAASSMSWTDGAAYSAQHSCQLSTRKHTAVHLAAAERPVQGNSGNKRCAREWGQLLLIGCQRLLTVSIAVDIYNAS